ncbi:MAG TPA: GAF domain-containing protein [Acidimicrobiales bacterium]|nr:GAF domain-containing protein [Acidimicrobiales bacterium]
MTDAEPGPGAGDTTSVGGGELGGRELDQLFLLHALSLEAGEVVARWWFQVRADAQDATTKEAFDELLRDVLNGIGHVFGADAVAVLVADESGDLVARAATGLQDEIWREVRISPGAGMAGRVLAERRAMVVDDLSAIEVASETLRQSKVRSLVAVPITSGDRVLGVLHADSYGEAHFTERDARLLTLVADRLGSALERVRLFDAERQARDRAEAAAERLGRLQAITSALSHDLDIDQVAEMVLSELGPELGDEVAGRMIWLVDGDRMRLLREWEASVYTTPFADMALDAALPGPEAVRTRRSLWLGTRAELEAYDALRHAELSLGAVAVLPLVVGGEALGVLAISYDEEREFEAEERNFLSVVAQQAAQALDRSRRRHARAESARHSAFLADVSAVLGSSLEVSPTLSRAARLMVPGLADMASVHLVDEVGSLRRVAMAHGDHAIDVALDSGDPADFYEARSVLLTMVAAADGPMLLPRPGMDMATDAAIDDEHERILRDLGIVSGIAVPLTARGESLGLLGLMRLAGSEPYGAADLELAAEIGRRASQAIDNALAHQRRVEVARALQASLLPPMLPEVTGVDVAAVFHPATKGVDVGGDFYDLFPLGDERWVLVIGDVSGSGPAAAALTAQVRHGARVAARAGLAPAAVVAAVNATLDETTGSEWFCTMVYAELTPHEDGIDLQVISAGHPAPLVLRGDHVEEVDCHGPLLGVIPTASFRARHLRLGPGDAMVMVTDGATEARSPLGHGLDMFFGDARLADVVRAESGRDARGMVDGVASSVLAFSGGQLGDDLAVVALRSVPTKRQNLDQ